MLLHARRKRDLAATDSSFGWRGQAQPNELYGHGLAALANGRMAARSAPGVSVRR